VDPKTELYTSEMVMQKLGISRGTFWKYVREQPDDFRTFVSGRWRVMTHDDLQHWIQFRKQQDAA